VSRACAFGVSSPDAVDTRDEGAVAEGRSGLSWLACHPEVVGPTTRTSAAKSAAIPAAKARGRKGPERFASPERFEFMLIDFSKRRVSFWKSNLIIARRAND
jgi:hypothetical protein